MVWRLYYRIPAHDRFFKAFVILLLCAVGQASLGVPVFPLVSKDASAPFPCQNRPCGCRNAVSCWRNCCCFTNAQKLAWAKQNGVKPPEYVVLAAKQEEPKSKCCCSKSAGKNAKLCATTVSPVREVVASPKKQNTSDSTVAVKTTLVVAQIDSVRKCQGLDNLWQILSQALEFRTEDPIQPSRDISGKIEISSTFGCSASQKPDVPPPRNERNS